MTAASRIVAISFIALLVHCSGSGNGDVVGPAGDDGGASTSSSTSSSSSSSSGSSSSSSGGGDASSPKDAAPTDAAASSTCTPNATKCTFPGSSCQCCTTASGPLCICTVTCKNDTQCPDSTLSLCNHPKGGSSPGICTARDAPACQ